MLPNYCWVVLELIILHFLNSPRVLRSCLATSAGMSSAGWTVHRTIPRSRRAGHYTLRIRWSLKKQTHMTTTHCSCMACWNGKYGGHCVWWLTLDFITKVRWNVSLPLIDVSLRVKTKLTSPVLGFHFRLAMQKRVLLTSKSNIRGP